MSKKIIKIEGARQHNLKNINLNIEKNKIIVFTGPSGAGKSSLVFDTIFAESQRLYIESLSIYVRQIIKIKNKPDIDNISGLSPSIAIDQNAQHRNSRSTLATITEIYDFLRLLFAKISKPYCPISKSTINIYSKPDIISKIMQNMLEEKICIIAEIKCCANFNVFIRYVLMNGFTKIYNKDTNEILEADGLEKGKDNIKYEAPFYVVVDRLVVKNEPSCMERLNDSIESSYNLNNKTVCILKIQAQTIEEFHMDYSVFGISVPKQISPRMFSFSNPEVYCKNCNGIGTELRLEPRLLIFNPSLSILNNVIAKDDANEEHKKTKINTVNHQDKIFIESYIEKMSEEHGISLDTIWRMIDDVKKEQILYGSSETKSKYTLMEMLEKLYKKYRWVDYKTQGACTLCNGSRLNSDVLKFKIQGLNISEVTEMNIIKASEWIKKISTQLSENEKKLANEIINKLIHKIETLIKIGLEYLSLNRSISTLSNGEIQRVRIASQIGTGLNDIIYILDEPSIGLHKADNKKLINSIQELKKLNNTVILVEHDEDTIASADYIVDIGPKAGIAGGYLIAEGTPEEIKNNPNSITGPYLKNINKINIPKCRRQLDGVKYVKVEHLTKNNFKDVSFEFPLSRLVCISGVSGSGKSTILMDVIKGAALRHTKNRMQNKKIYSAEFEISGLEEIDQIIEIDQMPIGKTPRSNPATYIGIFDQIRSWMACLPQSKIRGYTATNFSFNTKNGRCEKCEGYGMIKIAMHFLPDVYITCDVCNGKRYSKEILDIRYKNKDIGDILSMTASEAIKFFEEISMIREKLEILEEIGLGYISIGQPANTLSGGESQRMKIAKELSKKSTGKTLYILDEPTTGLHPSDIENLIKTINSLVNAGNSVIIIEHNMDILKISDYIIDVGPGAGENGGQIVAFGTPEEVAASEKSITGQCLKQILKFEDLAI